MRAVVFRVLAGLLAAAFFALLAFGDASQMSPRTMYGAGAVGVGFGLYALLGSDLGERLIWLAFGGAAQPPTDKHP